VKRFSDIILALVALLLLAIPCLFLCILICMTSKGPALFWSDRVGRDNKIFKMPKFRSMYIDTPHVATHLLTNQDRHITPLGKFMRKTSLDEIPQLWTILVGEMSVVGPRPALFNQDDLIKMRTQKGVHRLRPGLTGWAQINGRDDISIADKVLLDLTYAERSSFWFDLYIIAQTFVVVFKSKGIKH
jgi:O-antigen biosynthesis protein WbqP